MTNDLPALECIEREPPGDAAGTVIWLHGLGADGHDFEPVVPMLKVRAPLRFVFPHAPMRPVTINGGAEMRAWYDIDPRAPTSGTADIARSAAQVQALVDAEAERGTPPERIVLAGFSQGGVIALHMGTRASRPFAGIMALSTYVHDAEGLPGQVSFASVDTPIFMAHGHMDPMIPIARAVTSRHALEALNYRVEWRQYGMGHQVCAEELSDIGRWLDSVIGSAG